MARHYKGTRAGGCFWLLAAVMVIVIFLYVAASQGMLNWIFS